MSDKVLYRDQVIARVGEEAPMKATPGSETHDGAGDTITITEAAALEIKRQALQRGTPGAPIRVGIRGGGCTGFSYLFDWADPPKPKQNDLVFTAHGATVVCDPKSFKYLEGTELDFVTSMMGFGFKFNNPKATGSCGCGESVQF